MTARYEPETPQDIGAEPAGTASAAIAALNLGSASTLSTAQVQGIATSALTSAQVMALIPSATTTQLGFMIQQRQPLHRPA